MDRRTALYNELKDAGYPFEKPFNQYKADELQVIRDQLLNNPPIKAVPRSLPPVDMRAAADAADRPPAPRSNIPVAERDPNEFAGQRLNSHEPDEPIRRDPQTGFIWFQEEVRKPATAKPRGRRVITHNDPSVKKVTTKDGQFTETFEMTDTRSADVLTTTKVTLPSYQVGIYRNPKLPFKIHCYGGKEGFSRTEVDRFYGGAPLVPKEIKRIYVSNDLCYDIRDTIREIQAEDRRNQLSRGGNLS